MKFELTEELSEMYLKKIKEITQKANIRMQVLQHKINARELELDKYKASIEDKLQIPIGSELHDALHAIEFKESLWEGLSVKLDKAKGEANDLRNQIGSFYLERGTACTKETTLADLIFHLTKDIKFHDVLISRAETAESKASKLNAEKLKLLKIAEVYMVGTAHDEFLTEYKAWLKKRGKK